MCIRDSLPPPSSLTRPPSSLIPHLPPPSSSSYAHARTGLHRHCVRAARYSRSVSVYAWYYPSALPTPRLSMS
eukprot:2782517-Rhodomonas_salina.2